MPIIVKANRVPNWLRQFSHPEPQKRFIVFYFSPVCLFLCNPCHLIYIGLQVHILSNITKLLLNFSSLKSYWCPKAPGLTNLHLMIIYIRSASSCYCIRIHSSIKGVMFILDVTYDWLCVWRHNIPRLILPIPTSNCNSLKLFILWRTICSNNVHLKGNISNRSMGH